MSLEQDHREARERIERRYEGLDKDKVTAWLHEAKEILASFAPGGVKVETNSHSTATHAYVYLQKEGEEPLLVWYNTVWVSSHYYFNERGKVRGYQPGCEFAQPILDPFFAAIRDHLKAGSLSECDRFHSRQIEKIQDRRGRVERYREAFAGDPDSNG